MKKLMKKLEPVLVVALVLALLAWSLPPGQITLASSSLQVVCVPWQGDENIPHSTWSGKSITLKGTARYAGTVSWEWDFGDSSPALTGSATVIDSYPCPISATHAYTGPDGSIYVAKLTVTAGIESKSDTYLVRIEPYDLAVQVNVAIDEGLWWLYNQQSRYSSAGVDYGYWHSAYRVAHTASAVQAFENNLHKPYGDLNKDPYVDCVRRGLNYLTSMMFPVSIPIDDGDTNSNGIGVRCYHTSGVEMYEMGMAMMAIVGSDTPGRTAPSGPAGVVGRTYWELLQDMADFCAYAQNEGAYYGGGWRYQPNSSSSDNSVTQWPIMGLYAAENGWGITIADFVKPRLEGWLDRTRHSSGGWGYTDPSAYLNIDKTAGTGIAGLLFCGIPVSDSRIQNAVSFIDTHWTGLNIGDGYTMYGVMKAFSGEFLGLDNTGSHDWYQEYAQYLVTSQYTDGHWPVMGGHSYSIQLMSAWAVQILTRLLYEIPPTAVAKANGFDELAVDINQSVAFNGFLSRDGTYEIVTYEWDWDNDGIFDQMGATANHSYSADGIYTVTLRVIDNRDVVTSGAKPAMTDTDTCTIYVHAPPHSPIPDSNGPYYGWVDVPVSLNGSASWDPNQPPFGSDEIIGWYWDLDNDGVFDDASGATVNYTWTEPGIYPIALTVEALQDPKWPSEVSRTVVRIGNHDPVAYAGGPYTTGPGVSINLDGSGSYDPDESVGDFIVSYEWDLDNDGECDDASGETVPFESSVEGIFVVRLRVTDSYGATSIDATLVIVEFGALTIEATIFGSENSNSSVPYSDEPVNLATGNYFCTHQDLLIPGRGLSLGIMRFYNSMDTYSGPFGNGWTHYYNTNVAETPIGDVILMWVDGRRDLYTVNMDGTYTPPYAIYNILQKNADGSFTLTLKDQTRFQYNPDGKLDAIVDRNGNIVTCTYDLGGNLGAVTDASGRVLTIDVDSSGRICSISDPLGRNWSYEYDVDGNLIRCVNPAGGEYSYTYDVNNRMTTIEDPLGTVVATNGYDSSGRVISQANASGAVTTFAYDPANHTTIETDPLGRQTTYVYDEHFRELSRTDAVGNTTSYTYDANGNRNTITDANGHTTNYSYDSNGNVVEIIDALGNVTTMVYDSKNNLVSTTDALGRMTMFGYDTNGNLVEVTNASGSITAFAYDGNGQVTNSTDANGNTSSFAYDVYGNQIAMTDALGNTSDFTYDVVGRLLAVTDALGNTSLLGYDLLNRMTSISDPLGYSVSIGYDANGNRISFTDANGYPTEYSYDGLNQLTTVTDAMGGTASYIYDTVGNMVTMTDPNGHNTTSEYDLLNRLVGVLDPLGQGTTYQYDPVGNRIAMTDANDQETAYTYDALNRLTSITYDDGAGVTCAYDAVGNRIEMTDPTGTTSYDYDLVNRLTSATFPGLKTVAYSYDPVGNRASLTYPDGDMVIYEYDAANRLSAVIDWAARTTTYTYDAVGNVISVDYPNGASIDYRYDENNRLLEITNVDHKGAFANYTYTLDAMGNRISVTDIEDDTTSYSYDNLYRLTGVAEPNSDETYTYDSMGNRLAMTADDVTTTYAYDVGDRLLSLSMGGKVTSFAYDDNGNLVRRTEPKQGKSRRTTSYTWDAANHLIEVADTSPVSHFTYDGDGNRVKTVVGANEFNYVWDVLADLPVVLAQHGPAGTTKFVYGLGLICAESPDFLNFYHYDGLASVIALTNGQGQKNCEYTYDVWGNPQVPNGFLVGKNSLAFTGQQYDSRTNLLYLRARYYDPTTGRFLTRDPVSGFTSNTQDLNQYAYCYNNPVGLTDPSGRIVWLPVIIGVAATIGGVANAIHYWTTTPENLRDIGGVASAFGIGFGAAGLGATAAALAVMAIGPVLVGAGLSAAGAAVVGGIVSGGISAGVSTSIMNWAYERPITQNLALQIGAGTLFGGIGGAMLTSAQVGGMWTTTSWINGLGSPFGGYVGPNTIRYIGQSIFNSIVDQIVSSSVAQAK